MKMTFKIAIFYVQQKMHYKVEDLVTGCLAVNIWRQIAQSVDSI